MVSPAYIEQFGLPLIKTERLSLRMFHVYDFDSVLQLFNDEEVQKYLSPENRRNREQLEFTLKKMSEHWKERGFGLWCVSEKHGGKMLGYCGFQYFDQTLNVEILFAFFKDFWAKGFATEAANACLKFGFEELLFEKVFAATHPENTSSRRVLEKLGMVFEEKSTHYGVDTLTFSISRSDFKPTDNLYKITYKQLL